MPRVYRVAGYACKVGENAQDNWDLLDRSKKHHWFFHLTDFPSCYVILECDKEPCSDDKYLCAEICLDNTKQRKNRNIKVDATPCGNVIKGDEVGECEYKSERKVEEILVTQVRNLDPPEPAEAPEAAEVAAAQAAQAAARPRDPSRACHATASGQHLTVRKHASLGCALVSLGSGEERAAMLAAAREVEVCGVLVKLQPQMDKATGQEVPTDIFAVWGRQAEKDRPLSEEELLESLEDLRLRALGLVGSDVQQEVSADQ